MYVIVLKAHFVITDTIYSAVNFLEYDYAPSGQAQLVGRIKSHPDVAERHYPDLFKQYFPQGLPKQQQAY